MDTPTLIKSKQKISTVNVVIFGVLVITSAVLIGTFMAGVATSLVGVSEGAEEAAEITVSRNGLIVASTKVANDMEEQRRLPTNITVDGQALSSAQYLYLAAVLLKDISQGIHQETYPVSEILKDPLEPYPTIEFKDDFYRHPQTKETYLKIADKVIYRLNSNRPTPNYFGFGNSQEIKIRYSGMVHYMSSILRFYDFFALLPQSMDIKIVSPKNLVPESWEAPEEHREYISAITHHANTCDHLYYRHNIIDYKIFKFAKYLTANAPLHTALENIYDFVKYDTWADIGYAEAGTTPFKKGERSARDAFKTRLTASGGHDVKANAFYRTLGIPAFGSYVYYNDDSVWLNTDVHYLFGPDTLMLDDDGEMFDGFEDRPAPSKTEDFIEEIRDFMSVESSDEDYTFNGLFINPSDVQNYGADSIIEKAHSGGFNTVILTIKTGYSNLYFNPGDDLFGQFADQVKTDFALISLIEAAQEKDIKVHVGFNVLSDYQACWNNPELKLCQYYDKPDQETEEHSFGMISPCVPGYLHNLKTMLANIFSEYSIDGIVFMDLRWSVWQEGEGQGSKRGKNPACDLSYDKTDPDWHEQVLIDYLNELVAATRSFKEDAYISLLSSSFGKGWHSEASTGPDYRGQNLSQMSSLVDNLIINIGGFYWLTDRFFTSSLNNDLEYFYRNLHSYGDLSFAFNARDEWEYPPDFFLGLYKYLNNMGAEGFHLYSLASGWGEWGPAFSETQWSKIQNIGLPGSPICQDQDSDGYGYPASYLGCLHHGEDCDDADPSLHPGAGEICDNGIDDDCDGLVDFEDVECKVEPTEITVIDELGQPVPLVEVAAYSLSGIEIADKVTDSQGKADFNLSPQDYPVEIYFAATFIRDYESYETSSHIYSNPVLPPAQITLQRPPPSSLTILNPGVVAEGSSYSINVSAIGLEVGSSYVGFSGSGTDPEEEAIYEFYLSQDVTYYWRILVSDPFTRIDTERFSGIVHDTISLSSGPCLDGDEDGYGDPASLECTQPFLDCDDTDAAINPRTQEVCDGGIDEDCDGLIDSEDPTCLE